jgi:hypothetical protein
LFGEFFTASHTRQTKAQPVSEGHCRKELKLASAVLLKNPRIASIRGVYGLGQVYSFWI